LYQSGAPNFKLHLNIVTLMGVDRNKGKVRVELPHHRFQESSENPAFGAVVGFNVVPDRGLTGDSFRYFALPQDGDLDVRQERAQNVGLGRRLGTDVHVVDGWP
jgi:hypothetical protein